MKNKTDVNVADLKEKLGELLSQIETHALGRPRPEHLARRGTEAL